MFDSILARRIHCIGALVLGTTLLTASAAAQQGKGSQRRGISTATTPPPPPGNWPIRKGRGQPRSAGGGCDPSCTIIDFENIADLQVIGTITGPVDVTFGPSWLGLVDADAGGSGTFANEPSADTVAGAPFAPPDPIDFSEPVLFVEVFYTAGAASIPVTLTAYQGPGGTGNVVDSVVGNTVGKSTDGADCMGDPNGLYCLWDTLTLTSDVGIRSIVISGATANDFGLDDMSFCKSGDADGDSLLDNWELCGIDVNADGIVDLDLPGMGADPNVKDIFVEIDSMVGRAPIDLSGVVAAFDEQGIKLHLQQDETDISLAPWPNGFADFDLVKDARWGTAAERADMNWPNISQAKRMAFRYCIFGDQYGGGGSSGQGELPGNDFYVTLGHPSWNTTGGTEDQQAGTFMHELGHTLGLRHGGDDCVNYKPNYRSIMSYTWQLPTKWTKFGMGMQGGQWGLRYSEKALLTLDENDLDELAGVGGTIGNFVFFGPPTVKVGSEGGKINWNQMKPHNEQGVMVDVNHLTGGPSPGETLNGHDDWAALVYNFRNTVNYGNGVHLNLPDGSLDADTFNALDAMCPLPGDYCDPKVNSLGCTPLIGYTGSPTLSGPDDFFITATDVLGQECGILYWSLVEENLPAAGGTLCVGAPLVATPLQSSGGNAGDCSGTYSFHFSQAYMTSHNLVSGMNLYAQYISRDPGFNNSDPAIGLTNGLLFVICP